MLPKIPAKLEKYVNSYIFNQKTQELLYVRSENEKVKINDIKFFIVQINAIKNEDEPKLRLSKEQVEKIITLNGGHTSASKPQLIKRELSTIMSFIPLQIDEKKNGNHIKAF